MPSIYYMNPPPNPFWDFVSNVEDHPLFAAYGRPHTFRGRFANQQQEQTANAETAQPASEPVSEKARGKQPSVEDENVQDPPEIDPSTVKTPNNDTETPEAFRGMPFRGRGRFARAFEDGGEEHRRGGCHGRGRGGHRGPPGFWFPGHPFTHRGPPPPPGPPGHHDHHHGPPHGPHHDHHHGPHHSPPRGPHHGPHGHHPRGPAPEGFNLPEFLSKLGRRFGVDLSGATEGLGLDRFNAPRNNADADFEPRTDIFDTAQSYIIHLSLPGAKKDDVGVDWDGEHSLLRIAGVVHRPGVDEALMAHLSVDGRKKETGVFEKSIRLGTKHEPASIDVSGITAKMVDGVLVVKVPKVEVEHKKREVPISDSATPSPVREAAQYELHNEKQTIWDADSEMYDAAEAPVQTEGSGAEHKEKERQVLSQEEVEHEKMDEARSETVGPDHEELPKYEVEEPHESDWEKYSDEEEGEFVKINVD